MTGENTFISQRCTASCASRPPWTFTLSLKKPKSNAAVSKSTWLAQAVLEQDRRAIVQRDGVNIRAASRKVRRGDVEDPFLTVPAERRVGIIRVHNVFDRCSNGS